MTKRVRGLGAAAAGVAVAGGLALAGTWLEGLAGGAVIGIAIFLAPEVKGSWERRHAARERLEQVSAPATGPAPLSQPGPAALLRPDRQVVGFIDRPELSRLREWCDVADQPPVLLLTGVGGAGKTRLALELAREREALGWVCRVIRPGQEASVIPAIRAVTSGPVLLVADYAETRSGLAAMLREVSADGDGRLRVLLLARGTGEWWPQLAASTDAAVRSLARTAARVALTALPMEVDDADDVVRAAVGAFATALGVPVPEQLEMPVPAGPVPILVLHAAALLAVLDSRDQQLPGPARVVAEDQVLDDLLTRESAFWLGAAQTAGLAGPGGVDSVLAAQTVTVGCLFAAADETEAAELLRRVPGLADIPSATRRKIARWLQHLYPPPDTAGVTAAAPSWWGSLQPDLVAERHVVGQLTAAPDLAGGCLQKLDGNQARRVLTVLARACAHGADAPGLLASALRSDLPALGIPAVEVAVQTGGPLGRVLPAVLGDAAASIETLIAIQQAMPHPTVILAAADAVVTKRITQALPEDTAPAERARWADMFSVRLAQVGQLEQALAAAQEAVEIYRNLSVSDPGRYRPDLAGAVANLGVRFHLLGQPAEAAAVAEEAVAIRKELAEADPWYLPDLAISLSNLGADLAELGRTSPNGLAAVEEAVGIHRQLAQAEPDRYMPELAGSLVNLAALLTKAGRAAEARPLAEEAFGISVVLASTYPDRFLPDLAISLTDIAALLADLGQTAEALPAGVHAVSAYRQLAEINPDRYQVELAGSLTNLATILSEEGRPATALARAGEAVDILRSLTTRSASASRVQLASALCNLGVCLAGLGRHADARALTEEAVTIYRDLTGTSPGRYCPELATCLANLGIRLANLGHHSEARAATKEAVTLYRQLAADTPEKYKPDLASALSDLGMRFIATGAPLAALPVSQEAVRIYTELAATSLPGTSRGWAPR